MKPAKIDLQPLRELAAKSFEKFASEHPESTRDAGLLKQAALSMFAGDSANEETLDRWYFDLDERAKAMDVDIYLYASLQELVGKMNRLAQKSRRTAQG